MAPILFNPKSNQGITLIEVLVSIVILSTGVLGTVKLQITSIQATQQANYLNLATGLATEMSDKMMGNVALSDHPGDGNPYLGVDFRSEQTQGIPTASCYRHPCTADQLAAADIAEWLQKMHAALPEVRAVICRDDAPWDAAARRFTWDCHGGNDQAGIVIKLGWADKNLSQKYAAPLLVVPVPIPVTSE